MSKLPVKDPWARLRNHTKARIGLGRAGDAQPLESLLDFQLAHARARDAVHLPFDTDAIKDALEDLNPIVVASQAADRATYLRRPDLGRRLAPEDASQLAAGRWDAAFVLPMGFPRQPSWPMRRRSCGRYCLSSRAGRSRRR
jgi:ethanolamine ammonia-lyase small subunit